MEKIIYKLKYTIANIKSLVNLDQVSDFTFLEEELKKIIYIGEILLDNIEKVKEVTLIQYYKLCDRIKQLHIQAKASKTPNFEFGSERNTLINSLEIFAEAVEKSFNVNIEIKQKEKEEVKETSSPEAKLKNLGEDIHFYNNELIVAKRDFDASSSEDEFYTICEIHEQITELFKQVYPILEANSKGKLTGEVEVLANTIYDGFHFCNLIEIQLINPQKLNNVASNIKRLQERLYHLDTQVTLARAQYFIEGTKKL